MELFIKQFILLWAVIDPIGTIPIFLALTASITEQRHARRLAYKATLIAAIVLVFFVVVGEELLDAMSIPLEAFQVAGGIVLFLFAMTMIFGQGKPESELAIVNKGAYGAAYPLAIPSIASPGAMLAAVMLTDNHRFSVTHQMMTTFMILVVLGITLLAMLAATRLQRLIGASGASVISRVMGLILAAVATNSVLSGIAAYFGLATISA